MKTCPSCCVDKDASEFGKNKRRKDGLACYCWECSRKKAREYARTPTQQIKRKGWYQENREKVRVQNKERWETNKEKYEPARQQWAADNRDKMLGYYKDKGTAHRVFVDQIKFGQPCLDCDKTFPPYVMEFDHVRGVKRHNIGKMANHSRERVLAEIEKCELICCVCHRIRSHARREPAKTPKLIQFRVWINEIKDAPCTGCSLVFPPEAMDFDHVNGEKIIQISDMWSWGRPKVLAEIAKCELTCANCHRERTVFRMREAA